jgi:hypothetical protein
MCLNIDETLEAALGKWVAAGNIKQSLLGERELGVLFGVLPEEAFDYSTIYDAIGYTVSGAFLDWMSHLEELGGLGMTTLDFEMAFSYLTGGNVYNPELLEMEVTGYRTAIRTVSAFAVRNSDTPDTQDSFAARTETGGESVAYVTTGTVGDPGGGPPLPDRRPAAVRGPRDRRNRDLRRRRPGHLPRRDRLHHGVGRGVHVISSLLPPASQRNLHPFGLLDYTASFLGYLVLTSALGFQRVRETATTTRRYGRGDSWDLSGDSSGSDSSSSSGSTVTDTVTDGASAAVGEDGLRR